MEIPELFFKQNEEGLKNEKDEEMKETPLPEGYNLELCKIEIGDSPVVPLNLMVQAGLAVRNAEVISFSTSTESSISAVTFSVSMPTFRIRSLVLILNSKMQILTRGTVLKVTDTTVKILPETEFEDFEHYILIKGGSEVSHTRNVQSLRVLRTGRFPNRDLSDAAITYLNKLFGGREKRIFEKQGINNNEIKFEQLNESENKAANLILSAAKRNLTVIEGPPGTGKTFTLSAAIRQYIAFNQKSRVLISAASNIAVDNLLEEIAFPQALRLGSVARVYQKAEQYLLENKIEEAFEEELKDLQKDVFLLQRQLEKARKTSEKTGSRKEFLEVEFELRKANETLSAACKECQHEILKKSRLVAATLSGCESSEMLCATEEEGFDLVVVDEAAQALDIDLASAIFHCKGALILCGDPMELSPTILDKKDEKLWKFSIPILEKLCEYKEKEFDYVLLNTSYRFGDKINEFPSETFYNSQLESGVEQPVAFPLVDEDNVVLIDTAGLELEESVPDIEKGILQQMSLQNEGEAVLCKNICIRLLEQYKCEDIGIITPYAAECTLLEQSMEEEWEHGLEISTVDGFQGREKKVIVFSLVRSNDNEEIGFLEDIKRLNVSITRAQQELIVICDTMTFENKGTIGKWIAWLQDNCSCISGSEYQ